MLIGQIRSVNDQIKLGIRKLDVGDVVAADLNLVCRGDVVARKDHVRAGANRYKGGNVRERKESVIHLETEVDDVVADPGLIEPKAAGRSGGRSTRERRVEAPCDAAGTSVYEHHRFDPPTGGAVLPSVAGAVQTPAR